MLYSGPKANIYAESNIIGKLRIIQQVVEEKSRMGLSMAAPEDANVTWIRNISECCFAGSQIRINLHLGNKNKVNASRSPSQHTKLSDRDVKLKQEADAEGADGRIRFLINKAVSL